MPAQDYKRQATLISAAQGTVMRCPQCGGWAHVMRIAPAGDGQEQRTFECETCKQQTNVMVKTR